MYLSESFEEMAYCVYTVTNMGEFVEAEEQTRIARHLFHVPASNDERSRVGVAA